MTRRAAAPRGGAGPDLPEVVTLGLLVPSERAALYELFEGIVARGEGFPQLAPLAEEEFGAMWEAHVSAVVAARVGGELVGAAYLKPNGVGLAAHVANAGYVVAPPWRGRGIGRALVVDSITRAAELGFDALQFNFVFASNPARPLYASLGFRVVGTIPGAVRRPGAAGPEDALVYWRPVP